MMKTARCLVMAVALLCGALGVAHAAGEGDLDPHTACFHCHTYDSDGARVALRADEAALCLGCHTEADSHGNHAVGVRPEVAPGPLPLADGRITCSTCHEPHGMSVHEARLRLPEPRICLLCHKM
jgi:predicted CXXCH cytochrome family protein